MNRRQVKLTMVLFIICIGSLARDTVEASCTRLGSNVSNGTALTTSSWNSEWNNVYSCAQGLQTNITAVSSSSTWVLRSGDNMTGDLQFNNASCVSATGHNCYVDGVDVSALSDNLTSQSSFGSSIDSSEITNGTIVAADVGTNTLHDNNLAPGSVGPSEIADNSLTGDDIDESTLTGFVRTSGDSTISSGSLWFSNGTANVKISDNGSAYFLNSVGVGTANPASSDGRSRVVDISGGGVGENLPGLVLRSSVTAHTNKAWEILLGSESGTKSSFHIENNATERMRIDSNGYVFFPSIAAPDGNDLSPLMDPTSKELKYPSSSIRYKE